MKTAESLLNSLGVKNCTLRHVQIVNDYLKNGETDFRKLLDKLGDWDVNDYAIAKAWNELPNTIVKTYTQNEVIKMMFDLLYQDDLVSHFPDGTVDAINSTKFDKWFEKYK